MSKIFLSVLTAFSLNAFANDSGIAVVDVLGVAPAAPLNTEIVVYGKQLENFYEVLPTSFVFPEQFKSIAFASANYAVTIECQKEYKRPTTGEVRQDYMCTFKAVTRAASHIDEEDYNGFPVQASDFTTLSGSSVVSVLGIAPGIASGNVFSFYGGQAEYLANRIPSKLTFASGKYLATLGCKQSYKRPTTGEIRDDYICTLAMKLK